MAVHVAGVLARAIDAHKAVVEVILVTLCIK
jgi:hypothetical protein